MRPPHDGLEGQVLGHLERLQAEGTWAVRRPAPLAVAEPPVAKEATVTPPAEALADIAAEALECTACRLCERRTKVVFGVGPAAARVMFIGEGPGRDEDLQGEPFVGRAGQLLDKIIEAMRLQRTEVYIANAVKCRPPKNRNPLPDELASCRHFLLRQVAAVKPEVIVLLGRVATQAVLETDMALGRMRGRFHDWAGIPTLCTYHPAYLLRNPGDKRKTWEDIQRVMRFLAGERP